STEKTLATLLPGQKTYIGFYTNSGMLSLGMYDIVIKNSSDTGLVTNGIKVVTYISTAADPSEAINNDYILNRVGADGRGRFEYANQSMSISGSNKQLAFGTTEYYLCPLPSNDEPVGYSEIDSCSVDLHGSYGIISNITINPDKISAIILSPDWQQTTNTHYLAAEVTGRGVVTKTIPHKNGWVLKSSNSSSITIKTSLPAYDWAPLHVSVMEEP
ncbi:MAG TPA: hypothetical protein DIW17_17325, partial [Clostridiales bacterium]|nr:hypothetical protein [Clostridiales bacterium]